MGTLTRQRGRLLSLTGHDFPIPEVEGKPLQYFNRNQSEELSQSSDAEVVDTPGAVDAMPIVTAEAVESEDVEAEVERKLASLAQGDETLSPRGSALHTTRRLVVEKDAGTNLARVVEVPPDDNQLKFKPSKKRPRIQLDVALLLTANVC
eukprot:767776-Hanusia_phi.AAC.3